jgi:DNA-binding MarR family transcriptional regulator
LAGTHPASLENHLGYWLRYVSNHVSHAFARKVEAEGVSVAEWVVLREVYEAPMAPSALADRLGMTRGAISKIVDRLEKKGLAARTLSTADRRAQTVALTRTGRARVPKLAALADKNDAEFFGHLSGAERAQLFAAMQEIVHRRGLRTVPTE